MRFRGLIFCIILFCFGCREETLTDAFPTNYKCDCNVPEDSLTFQKFSSFKDANFKLINAPIDSINQLIKDEKIRPFEKSYENGKRQLWRHNGHPIKLNSISHWLSEEREMHTTFYIFDNCNGASEFHKFDTLVPKNLIAHRLFFYENRIAKHLFVEAMTTNGRTKLYQILTIINTPKARPYLCLNYLKEQFNFTGFIIITK